MELDVRNHSTFVWECPFCEDENDGMDNCECGASVGLVATSTKGG